MKNISFKTYLRVRFIVNSFEKFKICLANDFYLFIVN